MFLSEKSGDFVVGILAQVTLSIFLLYIASYSLQWFYAVCALARSIPVLLGLLLTLLGAVAFSIVSSASLLAAMEAISAVFRAQGTH
jgi:hypothetical protein